MNLKELSEKLGLSQTTVSRALNGYPEVSEKTRERVLEFARMMNYRPNSNARRLAIGRSNTIGHVAPLSDHDMINPHFTDFIAGAGEVYNERGYDMLISVTNDGDEEQVYRKLARDRRVDGVILHGPKADDSRIELLRELKLPFVVHGRMAGPAEGYCWVDVNNRRAFRKAAEYLLKAGHRRIGLINGLEYFAFATRRREGLESALAEYGIAPDPDIMFSGEMIEPNGFAAMTRFLAHPNPPTAVLCASVLTAIGAMRALQARGLSVGHDVSLVAYDDCLSFLPSTGEDPSMTVMRSSIRLAGRHCANMLIDQIEKKPGEQHLLLEAEFVVGASTGPVSQKATS
ncbi:LacI family DNA-binding transcriptional regulator [Oricola thermophila]|uniref:Substrate-binding domain-containing protein n=1 Tax=Oricola thermophila TaxID=2742145 RepID=A0A6N1VER5_9HYPH|nr:substrate-binding domain-containing protein [Oricola thermophila]QKV19450.1 substrate-binding domain-containing protein [Oricola thermophila]